MKVCQQAVVYQLPSNCGRLQHSRLRIRINEEAQAFLQ